MQRTLFVLAFAVVVSPGCEDAAPKKGGKVIAKDGAKKEAKARLPVEPDSAHSVRGLWNVYATDAVVWRERYAGRLVSLDLEPPHDILDGADKRFYVLQRYENGTRTEAVRVYLRDADAKRLSLISRGEEKVGRDEFLCVRAVISDDDFGFTDGQVVLAKRP